MQSKFLGVLLDVLIGISAGAVISAAQAAPQCQTAHEWKHWGDAEPDRLYVNETAGQFLLEYQADGSDGSAPTHTVFWTDFTVPAGTYKIRTVVAGGHSDRGFEILVDGAVDASTDKPVAWSVRSDRTKSLSATVRTSTGRISLRIRAISRNKIWSTVGPTTICSS